MQKLLNGHVLSMYADSGCSITLTAQALHAANLCINLDEQLLTNRIGRVATALRKLSHDDDRISKIDAIMEEPFNETKRYSNFPQVLNGQGCQFLSRGGVLIIKCLYFTFSYTSKYATFVGY